MQSYTPCATRFNRQQFMHRCRHSHLYNGITYICHICYENNIMIMRVSQKWTRFTFTYSLSKESLQEVAEAKYLGCTLSGELEWTKHIQNVTAKA